MKFVIPDIHGESDKLEEALVNLPVDFEELIFLGDYIDRGYDSKGVIDIIFDLKRKYDDKIILLLGNHDDAFHRIVSKKDKIDLYELEWISRYCIETMESYGINMEYLKNKSIDDIDSEKEYLLKILNRDIARFKNTIDYYKFDFVIKNTMLYYDDGLQVYSHSGGVSHIPISEQTKDQILWSRDFKERNDDRMYVVGHTPNESGKIETVGKIIKCDVGAVFNDLPLPLIAFGTMDENKEYFKDMDIDDGYVDTSGNVWKSVDVESVPDLLKFIDSGEPFKMSTFFETEDEGEIEISLSEISYTKNKDTGKVDFRYNVKILHEGSLTLELETETKNIGYELTVTDVEDEFTRNIESIIEEIENDL